MSLSDQVIVMKDGEIKQIGAPNKIYEDPDSRFVAGFVGKAAFFPVDVLGKDGTAWKVTLGNAALAIERAAPAISAGQKTVLMARPESLRLTESGAGHVDGKVKMNVYLGHSIETFVQTAYGEVLIQIDDPLSKKIYAEGEGVSISFDPARVKLLPDE
jgi:iron(III) transport system ATP-binding protein